MIETAALTALLACPRCDQSLEARDGQYRCSGCHVDFPALAGLPFLFAEPGHAWAEWRGRLHYQLREHAHERAKLGRALERTALSERMRTGLERHAAALDDHVAKLRALLEPLDVEALGAAKETYLALRTRLPSDQGLHTYYQNVHRDWAWGAEENDRSVEIVLAAAGAPLAGRTLVLGAGAGRLAHDLHRRSKAELTVALDFNPMLVLIANRVTRGETLELYEFPIAPRTLGDRAVLRSLKSDSPAREGLAFVIADVNRPPFAKGAFDTVVTPWLVDILPSGFDLLCARVNNLLCDGGQWLNFGSLSFESADPAQRYGPDEAAEVVASNGFDTPALFEHDMPYMCSPASRHGRRESVVSWCARKTRHSKKVPRHSALPDWLVRGQEPVPALDAFKMQAMSTRIHAFIMSLIDGRRSLKDMAQVMADQKLMPRDEAEGALRAFLITMYEDSRRT